MTKVKRTKAVDVLQGREDVCRMLDSELAELDKRIITATRSFERAREDLGAVVRAQQEARRILRAIRPKTTQLTRKNP